MEENKILMESGIDTKMRTTQGPPGYGSNSSAPVYGTYDEPPQYSESPMFPSTSTSIPRTKERGHQLYPDTRAQPPSQLDLDRRLSEPRALEPHMGAPFIRLDKPIVIPTSEKKIEAPFLRAYPSVLSTRDISKTTFLSLLDRLNDVKKGSPPLQVLGAAAGVVGFVPSHIAQAVSAGVQVATTVGHIAISKGRTELYLREINQEVFEPKGLKMEIAKLDAVAKITGMEHLFNEKGKLDKAARLLEPDEDMEAMRDLSVQQRRLSALEPWIAPLDLEPITPEMMQEMNALKRFGAKAASKRSAKKEEKLAEERIKNSEKLDKDTAKAQKEVDKELSKLAKEEDKVRRKCASEPGKLEEEMRKIEKEREKALKEYNKELGKVEKDYKKDDKEEELFRRLTFLIIRDLDADSGAGENPVL